MKQVVLLHLPHVGRQLGVVKRIVHTVIAHVHRKRSRDDAVGKGCRREDEVGQPREGEGEDEEEEWRHDEAKAVHGQVVVDSVQEEVQCEEWTSVGEELVDVEEEAMQSVLEKRPDEDAERKAGRRSCCGGWAEGDGCVEWNELCLALLEQRELLR